MNVSLAIDDNSDDGSIIAEVESTDDTEFEKLSVTDQFMNRIDRHEELKSLTVEQDIFKPGDVVEYSEINQNKVGGKSKRDRSKCGRSKLGKLKLGQTKRAKSKRGRSKLGKSKLGQTKRAKSKRGRSKKSTASKY